MTSAMKNTARPRPRRRRALGLLAAGTMLLAQPAAAQKELPEFPARALDSRLSWEELDRLTIDRYAMSETGREALKHLVRARLLDVLARESKLVVGPAEVKQRWDEIERQVIAAGEGKSLGEYLGKSRVDPQTFREFLRLGIVQETLARRALGLDADRPLNSEQQEMWLDEVVVQRGSYTPPPPWQDGVAARCGDLEVLTSEYLPHLRSQLDAADVREDCYQLLLAKRLRARMPDLAPEALERAVDVELERRRGEYAADPKYQGLSFDQILSARGVSPQALRRDPAVLSAALAQLWVDRTYGDEGLRTVYQGEREWFDGRFGRSVEVRVLFLRAAKLTNQLNPRSFEAAELELSKLAERLKTPAQFVEAVGQDSEDPNTRERGGRLGFVTRAEERVPEEVRAAAFSVTVPPAGRLVGPVRIGGGVVLLWLGETRPAPGWEFMREHVHRELRRRHMDKELPRDSVVTYLGEG